MTDQKYGGKTAAELQAMVNEIAAMGCAPRVTCEYIVAAVNALPDLLAEIERLRAAPPRNCPVCSGTVDGGCVCRFGGR